MPHTVRLLQELDANLGLLSVVPRLGTFATDEGDMKPNDITEDDVDRAIRPAVSAPLPWVERRRVRCAGQSVLESGLVIVIAALLGFGLLQVAQLMIAKGVLTYAAAAGARARTVGFNDFMVEKVIQVAAIPTAGAREYPIEMNGSLDDQIGFYLAAESSGRLSAILQYERWPDLRFQESGTGSAMVHVRAEQNIPLVFPFHRAFYWDDSVLIQSGEADRNHLISRGRHADLYLE